MDNYATTRRIERRRQSVERELRKAVRKACPTRKLRNEAIERAATGKSWGKRT